MKSYEGEPVEALVLKTGFNTSKGLLIKSILFPKPTKFTFYADSLKFIFSMGILAVFGFIVTLPAQLKIIPPKEIAMKFIDLFSIIIPPMLPAAMSVGMLVAVGRLRKKSIFCI